MNTTIPCPVCGKPCKGEMGLQTHNEFAHDPVQREKRLAAAKLAGVKRMRRNRARLVPKQEVAATALQRAAKKAIREVKRYPVDVPAKRVPINFCPNCGYHLEPVSLAAGYNETKNQS